MDRVLPGENLPGLSPRYLIKEFLNAVTELSIVVILGLFLEQKISVNFGAGNFVKGLAVLINEGIQIPRLDGLLYSIWVSKTCYAS